MKIIYLAAYKALHPNWDMTYQDINGKRDIGGDMMETDLTPYDVIVATPPCNYYSTMNYRRETSTYAQSTKHLLPSIIHKLAAINKPFIVENVRSSFIDQVVKNSPSHIHVYKHGRHTYWTNVQFNPSNIPQVKDFKFHGIRLHGSTQGGDNVHNVIEYWLEVVRAALDNHTRLEVE